ncbi:MAG: response regulator [Alphaproteobacteria bacterium]
MSQEYQILIVDDSRVARMMARTCVAKAAPTATIIEADSGDDALEKLGGIDITAGIVDLNMPGMNGLELAFELRQRFADIPLALCTANIQETIRQRAKEQNILFIAKPISAEKVRVFLHESVEA